MIMSPFSVSTFCFSASGLYLLPIWPAKVELNKLNAYGLLAWGTW